MVSASGSLLSEVTQGAATVWRCLLLNIPRQCIHVVARAATITCMVRGGCNCMEWGLVTCGGRGRMVNKQAWAATPRKGHHGSFLCFLLHRITAITNGKGKGKDVSVYKMMISN